MSGSSIAASREEPGNCGRSSTWLDAGEQLAEFCEVELGDEDGRGEIEFALAGGCEAGEDADVLVVDLDVAGEDEAVAVLRGEA